MGIDLRLTGAMIAIAYLAYVVIGQAVSPLASSRRRVRRLQLWYARSIAGVLVLCSLVSLVVPAGSLKEGVVLALTTAILPMAAVSLVFSALVIRRLFFRWRGRRGVSESRRREPIAPVSLAELGEREQGTQPSEESAERAGSPGLDAELDELDQRLEEDLLQQQQASRDYDEPFDADRLDTAASASSERELIAEQARQRRA